MRQNKHYYDMNDIATRFISILRERIDTEAGQAIILKMVGEMDSERLNIIADECEDMVKFQNYLSEDEADCIVRKFVNFDGSKGPHWSDPDAAFRAVQALGMTYEDEGEFNRWAFFAVLNMVWSDEWGVLHNYVEQDQEVRVCAELAHARLEDRDKVFSVRKYFDV
jgi:hypothetical protein